MKNPVTAMAYRAVCCVGIAACVAGAADDTHASTVSAISQIDLPYILDVYRASDNATLDPNGSIAVETGGINLAVTRTTPGVSSASGNDVAQIKNLLGEAIEVVFDEYFLTDASYTLNGPGLRATARAEWQILMDGVLLDLGQASINSDGCIFGFQCADQDIDPGAWTLSAFLNPGQTVVFTISGSVQAALTAVPLPPSAGLLLLALGALVTRRGAVVRA